MGDKDFGLIAYWTGIQTLLRLFILNDAFCFLILIDMFIVKIDWMYMTITRHGYIL